MAMSISSDLIHPTSDAAPCCFNSSGAKSGQEISPRTSPSSYSELATSFSTGVSLDGLSLVDDILYRMLDMSWLSRDGFIKSLSLTSRRLRMICLPYLFREHRWYPVLQNLLPRSLWRFIKVFHLDTFEYRYFTIPRFFYEDLLASLISALPAMPFLTTFKVSRFPDALWHRLMTGVVCIPTLECLQVYFPILYDYSPHYEIRLPTGPEPPLNLTHFILHRRDHDQNNYGCLTTLRSTSTSLRSLRVSGGPDELDFLKSTNWPKLQELTITLTCDWYANVSFYPVEDLLVFMPLLKTLRVYCVRPKFETLETDDEGHTYSRSVHNPGLSGGNPGLTTLTISGVPSTGYILNHLPSTLQTLVLLEGRGDLLHQDELVSLLDKSSLPNLVMLVIAIDTTPVNYKLFTFLGSKLPLLKVLEVRQRYHFCGLARSPPEILNIICFQGSGLQQLEVLRLDLPELYGAPYDLLAKWIARIALYIPWIHEIALKIRRNFWVSFRVQEQLKGQIIVEDDKITQGEFLDTLSPSQVLARLRLSYPVK